MVTFKLPTQAPFWAQNLCPHTASFIQCGLLRTAMAMGASLGEGRAGMKRGVQQDGERKRAVGAGAALGPSRHGRQACQSCPGALLHAAISPGQQALYLHWPSISQPPGSLIPVHLQQHGHDFL